MRCTNCGWDNTPGSARCIKCNTLIVAVPQKQNDFPPPAQKQENPYGGTVTDTDHGAAGPASPNEIIDGDKVKCTHCGFPNLSGAEVCSNCQKPIGGPGVLTIRPGIPHTPTAVKGTIDPYVSKFTEDQTCYLQLVNKEDQYGVTDELINQTLEFSGSDSPIELNRGNIDPENMTITSKVQAELVSKNGKWFLKDRSDLQTTFIRVGESTELKDGDVIIMGDRKFIFSTPQN